MFGAFDKTINCPNVMGNSKTSLRACREIYIASSNIVANELLLLPLGAMRLLEVDLSLVASGNDD